MDSDLTTGMVVLAEILYHENLTISMLGEKLGMNRPQALYDINTGKTKNISAKMADKICSAFPHYNRSWLMSGEGEILKDSAEAPKKPHRAPKEVEVVPAGSRIVQRLPIIPIKAQAGVGKGFLYDRDESQDPEDVYEEFDTMEVALEREVSDRYKLFRVTGNSMDDDSKRSICDGDIVLCREVYPEDWGYGLINTKYPYVVIVIEEEGILIKELIKHSRKDNTITLHSLNSNYEDFTKSLSDVRAFFYVERIDRSVQVW